MNEVGSAMQDIMSQIFHGLSKGIHDVDIRLTIHEPNLALRILLKIECILKMVSLPLIKK